MVREETQKVKEEVRDQITRKEKLEMKKKHLAKVEQINDQEMERKRVLALKENQVFKVNHQEIKRKKVLALKENQVL